MRFAGCFTKLLEPGEGTANLMVRKGDDNDDPTPKLPLPGEYRLVERRRRVRDPDDVRDPDRGNGTGRTDLNRVKDEEIARLRVLLAERDSNPSVGSTAKHGGRMLAGISGVVTLVSMLFAGLAWYTSAMITSANNAERLVVQERIDASFRTQIASARLAPMETVAVQQQQLSDINRRLTDMDTKLDTLLARVRVR
jgi:hypothetical protein